MISITSIAQIQFYHDASGSYNAASQRIGLSAKSSWPPASGLDALHTFNSLDPTHSIDTADTLSKGLKTGDLIDLMVVTPELLSAFPILKPLPKAVLAKLADSSLLKKFSRRGIVLSAGERQDVVCFLFEGRLQGVDFTIDGREVGLYFVEPGDFCGELALFDEQAQPEFVIALTSAVVVFVPVKELQEIMLKTPGVMNVLGNKLAGRVRQMTFQRSLLGLPNIAQRVCCQLWLLVSEKDKLRVEHSDDMIEIANPPTHMEIAIMLNVSRETVTRVFQTLQNRQIVRRDGPAKLIVGKPKALQQFADGSEDL